MGDKAYPLWEETKLTLWIPYLEAGNYAEKYRRSRNPAHLHHMQNKCMQAWSSIKVYEDILEGNGHDKLQKELDTMILDIPAEKRKDIAFWVKVYNFLGYAYRKIGITDIAKKTEEVDPENAWLSGVFGGN